jgi:multidrug efflux pump subunit AcrA (membrane-fusion protein)
VSLRAPTANAKPRIKLPTSALRTEAGATSVWVLDSATMTVKSQAVQVTTADGNDAVVDSGLQNGDQVVVSGVHVLTAGQKVSIFGAVK